MQKGFGLVIFIVVVFILLAVLGGGFWLGRESTKIISINSSSNRTEQTKIADHSSTNFTKRNYDPRKDLYPGFPLPVALTSVDEASLVGFNCDGPYLRNNEGQYLWSVQIDGEAYLKPLTVDLSDKVSKINDYLKQVGYHEMAVYITYCVTEKGAAYLLAGQPIPKGGAGSDTYIIDLNQNNAESAEAVVKSEDWPYFGCSTILQISQDAMDIFCAAGDGGFSGQAIYRKSLVKNEINPLIKCTNQAQPDSDTSVTSCQ